MGRFIIILFFIVGCSTNHEQQQIVEQGFQKERRDSLFEPIDQQILAGFLPDSIPEFVLSKKDTESTGGFGYKVSTVIGTYANPQNDKKIKLYISDASGAKSILGAGAWANLDFDKANEYTSELEGHKYYYKINKRRSAAAPQDNSELWGGNTVDKACRVLGIYKLTVITYCKTATAS